MKNFNIFIFKTRKKLLSPNIVEQSDADCKFEREAIRAEFDKFIKVLKECSIEEYNDLFKKGIERIGKYYNFPEQKLRGIGYDITFTKNKPVVVINPVSVDVIEDNLEKILSSTFNKVEGEMENMDFAYQLWRDKFINGNGTIWLTAEDLENAIALADGAIGDKYHPEEYLPQEDGEYDKKYVKDVRAFRLTCKRLLKLMKKKYEIYAIIFQGGSLKAKSS